MLAVLSAYVAVQVIDLVTEPMPDRGVKLTVDLACLAGLFALTLAVTAEAAERWSRQRRLATLVAEAVLTYLPLVLFGRYWADMAGFFAGSALLVLSGAMAWTLFAAVVASMLVMPLVQQLGAYSTANLTLSTLVLGLVVFGLARLAVAVRYVHATRGELAQLAVISERMRFARDLHDLLGYSLSAITLKAELTGRLVDGDPDRARHEVAEVIEIARQALDDVRTVASGYRNISLAMEASSVTSLLATAGIRAHVDVACGALDEKVDTVLATILREAVTNMLRHSAARNCAIEAEADADLVRLMVRNDGASRDTVPVASPNGRRGLENLRTRLEAIGGKLTVEQPGDGWFNLVAEAPAEPVVAPQPAVDGDAGLRWRRRAAKGRRRDVSHAHGGV
jgi:two-component system, NarL family, sensor histidine kinase DesK